MEENAVLFELFGKPVSPYAAFTAIGALLGFCLFLFLARKQKKPAVALAAVLAVPLGLLGARAFYVVARWSLFAEIGFHNFFRSAEEDYAYWGSANGAAFWGAAGGVALAAFCTAKLTRWKTSALLDAFAPGAALALALSRFGEFSIGEGIGPDVSVEGLRFFPIAVVNEWEEWKYAVFLLEGIVALIIFRVLLARGGALKEGYKARLFLVLFCSSQILLESLRRDNFLRWLFVRVSQLTAVIVLAFLILFAILRRAKKPAAERMPMKQVAVCCAVFLLLVGAMIILEFALDKSENLTVPMGYLLETLCAVGFGIVSYRLVMKN